MKNILYIFLFLALTINVLAQVVNVESRRMRTDTTGWSGTAEGSFQYSKSVDEIFDFGALFHLQYKTKNDLWLFLNEMRIIKGAGKQFVNTGFAHIRYNRKITKDLLRWEIFTQYQYNKALDVGQRILAGTGPRFKIYDSDIFHAYFGALYMFEYQESVDKSIVERNHRTSSYISLTLQFERFEIRNTTYYQPDMMELKDYRILAQTDLLIMLTDELSFTTGFNYRFDTRPFPGAPKTTYYLKNGLLLEF
ncbi:MAG: DUF481 domain-containing protein [Ignavibacteria bacterium]|nr:DUF481 domain-containing protein [Ignavibacteria bacterium]